MFPGRWVVAIAAAVLSVPGSNVGAQQDGLVAFPDVYRVQFENAWVRVVRVRIPGNANIGMHSHPPGFMVHVYLNDADPITFQHDGPPGDINRPPVLARSYRVGRATPESHAISNPSPQLTDFMRVEYKTRGNESSRRRASGGALGPETTVAVEHTGEQSRVSRITIAGGDSIALAMTDAPGLLVMLTAGNVVDSPGGVARAVTVGTERFIDVGGRVSLRNAGTSPIQLLRFDFLTRPAGS